MRIPTHICTHKHTCMQYIHTRVHTRSISPVPPLSTLLSFPPRSLESLFHDLLSGLQLPLRCRPCPSDGCVYRWPRESSPVGEGGGFHSCRPCPSSHRSQPLWGLLPLESPQVPTPTSFSVPSQERRQGSAVSRLCKPHPELTSHPLQLFLFLPLRLLPSSPSSSSLIIRPVPWLSPSTPRSTETPLSRVTRVSLDTTSASETLSCTTS